MARHKTVKPMADQYEVTLEQRNFMRRRTAFLLERINQGPERPLADLLANAYAQGLEDAMTTLDRAGRLKWPDSAPAQQDGWAS